MPRLSGMRSSRAVLPRSTVAAALYIDGGWTAR